MTIIMSYIECQYFQINPNAFYFPILFISHLLLRTCFYLSKSNIFKWKYIYQRNIPMNRKSSDYQLHYRHSNSGNFVFIQSLNIVLVQVLISNNNIKWNYLSPPKIFILWIKKWQTKQMSTIHNDLIFKFLM